MKFRTEIDIARAGQGIGYNDRIALLGSCFADNIAAKLREYYFPIIANPTGTLYNPVSVARHIDDVADANIIFITFGTAWVYMDKSQITNPESQLSAVVDNCQKRPASDFIRRRMTVNDIVAIWLPLIQKHADKRFIFTVSPIRHIKDGLHENNLSKSILLLAVERLVQESGAEYFPAYEIVQDELRDYRFYADDLVHPSSQAVAYIWERLVETYFSHETQAAMAELHQLWLNRQHRSLHPGSPEDEAFKQHTEDLFHSLAAKYPWLKG